MADKVIALVGSMDTKGIEYAFVKTCIEQAGLSTLVIDTGSGAPDRIKPDISSDQVRMAAQAEPTAPDDRGKAMAIAAQGLARLLPELHQQGRFSGVIALGGTGGTAVACQGMRTLPLGVPKVMVSTVAGGDVSAYVGLKDIVMIPSIVDVAGINKISREVFARAAGTICGMVQAVVPIGQDKPIIAASMFGNTTPAVNTAKAILEEAGYEVLVFHCTGQGGRMMESLIEAGMVAGVLDITTTEWADELVGGVFHAGPARLEAAARNGVPAVVAPGCLDMVNFGAPDTVPARFSGRTFYQHNSNVTLMRTDEQECCRLGDILAQKVNLSIGPVAVVLPLRGLSMIDLEGKPFYQPAANAALFDAIRSNLRKDIPLDEMDCDVNNPEFARHCAKTLIASMNSQAQQR